MYSTIIRCRIVNIDIDMYMYGIEMSRTINTYTYIINLYVLLINIPLIYIIYQTIRRGIGPLSYL